MPELPEVETLRLQLNPILKGQVISKLEILNKKTFHGDPKLIINRKITGISRFAKVLVFETKDVAIAIHLKMSGRLIYRGKKQPKNLKIDDIELKKLPNSHTRVTFHFKSGDILYFTDQRKFGWIKLLDRVKREALKEKLGIEPFSKNFNVENLYKITSKINRPIKVVLMDQSLISGIGNIYANDGLFCAKIHPKTKAKDLDKKQIQKLHECLLMVLKNGIKYKGASENLFRDAFGQKGELQNYFYVYAREGKPCKVCRTPIVKFRLGGRGTFFCPKCQKSQ
ncbi:DNA-formamidopyrimidine glycosylase [Candidatus Gottesmanbacteria bacterium]|nr:DNA-formamidopyrimidine glycosylase [Candidatus Gottesmanbacteria bacterium]